MMNVTNHFPASLRRLGAGVGMLGGTLLAGYVLTHPWLRRWGATTDEARRPLAGDALVPHPKLATTRAITINAPADRIWPWLVQIGKDRGGFYSYDWLENLFGLDIHSADSIVPEWQYLEVGDAVPLAPPPGPSFVVALIEPERALVLRGYDEIQESAVEVMDSGLHTAEFTWAFILEPLDEETTRLLVRRRASWPSGIGNTLLWRGFSEPAGFVMEQKMMRGLKQRAEAPGEAMPA